MDLWLREIAQRTATAESVVLCTVVAARGSTPQAAGARMLLLASGQQVGTLGGGCVEAEVRQRALIMLAARQSGLLTFKLDHDYGWDDGLICGGAMDIYIEVLTNPLAAHSYADALAALEAGQSATVDLEYQTDAGEKRTYHEVLEPAPRLVIAGAGHVGQALARLAADAGFQVAILDDRADVASLERFPTANQRIIGDIETELRRLPIYSQTYIVIVTRGHRHDGRALAAVIDSEAPYIGLIGSRRKILTIFRDLASQGVPVEKLFRVHAPIGLEIGAITVPEIAVSIAAELIATRRGRADCAAPPMKYPSDALRQLLEES